MKAIRPGCSSLQRQHRDVPRQTLERYTVVTQVSGNLAFSKSSISSFCSNVSSEIGKYDSACYTSSFKYDSYFKLPTILQKSVLYGSKGGGIFFFSSNMRANWIRLKMLNINGFIYLHFSVGLSDSCTLKSQTIVCYSAGALS